MSTTPNDLIELLDTCIKNEKYKSIARAAWSSAEGVTEFHKKAISAKGSSLFNKEFREIYWRIGREEFPEKIIALQELRDAEILRDTEIRFSDKSTSYQKSKLLNRIKTLHYP
jgi:hypothetical protein